MWAQSTVFKVMTPNVSLHKRCRRCWAGYDCTRGDHGSAYVVVCGPRSRVTFRLCVLRMNHRAKWRKLRSAGRFLVWCSARARVLCVCPNFVLQRWRGMVGEWICVAGPLPGTARDATPALGLEEWDIGDGLPWRKRVALKAGARPPRCYV